MARGKKARIKLFTIQQDDTEDSIVLLENNDIVKGTKIEGSVVRFIDSTPQNTGKFSIAQVEVFTNESPITPFSNYTPQFKTTSQLKNYFEVNGKTYKFMDNAFSQSPNITQNTDYSFQFVKSKIVDATPSCIASIPCTVEDFNIHSNASLRLKWTGATTDAVLLNANNIKEAMQVLVKSKARPNAVYVYEGSANSLLENNDIVNSNLSRYNIKYTLKSIIAILDNGKKDTLNKFVIYQDNNKYYAIPNNIHYYQVDGMDFTSCKEMEDVLTILNNQGFNALFTYEDGCLKIYTKAVGDKITIDVVECIGEDVVFDLKNSLFTDGTPANITTDNTINTVNFDSINDGELNVVINGTPTLIEGIDFTGQTNTIGTLVNTLNAKATAGIIFSVVNDTNIKISTTLIGSSASIDVVASTGTGTDLLNSSFFTFGLPVSGSDGAVKTTGTNASNNDILELYNKYNDNPDFNGSVITTTNALDIDFLYELNNQIVANIALGNRVIFCHTIEDPFMTEATSHGYLLDWLRTDLIGLYCGGLTDIANLQLRSAVLSIGLSQNCVSNNKQIGEANGMAMADAVVPLARVNASINNDFLELVSSNGVGSFSYFKEGFGWKIHNPRTGNNNWCWCDAINIQNIIKTSGIALVNFQASRKNLKKTNANITLAKEVIYRICETASSNNVLTGDIKDFSQIQYDTNAAIAHITQDISHAYIYAPKAQDIEGDVVPFTLYLGMGQEIYGWTITIVYMK